MSTAPAPTDVDAATMLRVMSDFGAFCQESGIRESALTRALSDAIDPDAIDSPLDCVAISTPPQEGKTTLLLHYIAWQLVRNPALRIIYASYSQFRANSVSRSIRMLVERWTPLRRGSSNISQWQTERGGGLLAAGRGTGVTGFSCDLLVIDDPIKDMNEAQSELIRETTVDWFSSVLVTRMAALSSIVVCATRWHRADLIAHVQKAMNARYVNIPAQSVEDDDPLGRAPGEWLASVQNRSVESWEKTKATVGPYVWSALYQGNPQTVGGSMIDVGKIDTIPWGQVVYRDDRGFMMTLDRALVIQSWDLTFGSVPGASSRRGKSSGDFVAGHVYAIVGQKWILIDRVHERLTFTQTLTRVQQMAARWPQTSRVYVEKAANGAAVLDSLRKRAALIKPVTPRGSKEARVLGAQPVIDAGNYAVLDSVYDDGMFREFREFPLGAHDDDVDAMSQALNNGRADYFRMTD